MTGLEIVIENHKSKIPGELLARRELSHITGIAPNDLVFSKNEYGKPFLANVSGVHFNISHSGNYTVLCVDDEPVGIDIEIIRSFESKLKIAKRFFTTDEFDYINSSDNEALMTRRFFEVWTKKESRIKLEGKGLSMPLPSFSVLKFDKVNPVYYHEVPVSDDAICHLCSANPEIYTILRTQACRINRERQYIH